LVDVDSSFGFNTYLFRKETLMPELPIHWLKMNKVPWSPTEINPNAVYMILFFKLRRALILRKDYSVICTMETRKAKQLLSEAKEQGWVGVELPDCKLGDRAVDYPKRADFGYWVEVQTKIDQK
jgi:hypothetical protein